MLVRWLCFVLIALLSTPALAATAWIDDEIYVPVRSGAGSGYRIVHRGLKSGTRVEFLGEDGDWAHIRFGDTEGYIGKQYISRSPTAAIRLEQISGDRKQMESRMTEMRERLSSVEAERDRLSAENEELKGSLSSRSDELENLRDVAADPIRLDQGKIVSGIHPELDRLGLGDGLHGGHHLGGNLRDLNRREPQAQSISLQL